MLLYITEAFRAYCFRRVKAFARYYRIRAVAELPLRLGNIAFRFRAAAALHPGRSLFVPLEHLHGAKTVFAPAPRYRSKRALRHGGKPHTFPRSAPCAFLCRARKLRRALSAPCGYRNDGAAERIRKLFGIEGYSLPPHRIGHIHRDRHRNAELDKLQCQIYSSDRLCAVDNAYDNIGLAAEKRFARAKLLRRKRGKRIYPRQIADIQLRIQRAGAGFGIHRNAGAVADGSFPAGKHVEKRCFAAVRVARK